MSSERADRIVDRIDSPTLASRSAANGTARGALREWLYHYQRRPELARRSWRDLVSLVGAVEAERLRNQALNQIGPVDPGDQLAPD